MINIAVIDDDIYFLDLIKHKLLNADMDLNVCCFNNPYDFIDQSNDFDYALLDIELPQIDGISLSKQLRNNDISVFFITIHRELMIKSFGKNVEGFILKDDIDKGIELFLQFLEIHSQECYISIKIDRKEINVNYNDILYIKYSLRDIEYYLINNKKLVQKNTNLKDIFKKLNNNFIIVNRNTIINSLYIDKLKKDNVYVRNEKFKVSRRRQKEVKFKLVDRMFNNGYYFSS